MKDLRLTVSGQVACRYSLNAVRRRRIRYRRRDIDPSLVNLRLQPGKVVMNLLRYDFKVDFEITMCYCVTHLVSRREWVK